MVAQCDLPQYLALSGSAGLVTGSGYIPVPVDVTRGGAGTIAEITNVTDAKALGIAFVTCSTAAQPSEGG